MIPCTSSTRDANLFSTIYHSWCNEFNFTLINCHSTTSSEICTTTLCLLLTRDDELSGAARKKKQDIETSWPFREAFSLSTPGGNTLCRKRASHLHDKIVSTRGITCHNQRDKNNIDGQCQRDSLENGRENSHSNSSSIVGMLRMN